MFEALRDFVQYSRPVAIVVGLVIILLFTLIILMAAKGNLFKDAA